MADPEKEVAKGADGQDAKEAFKAALREACDKAVRDNRPAIVDDVFRRYRDNIPEEYAGNRDRTYWFFYMTTILKTLGATDGLKAIRELWPATTELETAFLVATGKNLENEDKDIAHDGYCFIKNTDCRKEQHQLYITHAKRPYP